MITHFKERSQDVQQALNGAFERAGLAKQDARDAASALETLWSYTIGVGGLIEELAASQGSRTAMHELFRALAVDLGLLDRNLPWLMDRARKIAESVSSDAFGTRDREVEETLDAIAHFAGRAEDRADLASAIVDGRRLARSITVRLTFRDMLRAQPHDIAHLLSEMDALSEQLERVSAKLESMSTLPNPARTDSE